TSVADLVALALDRLDEVQVLPPTHLAQHDVAHLELLGRRRHRHELARVDLPAHRMAARAKLHRLAFLKFRDVSACPAHQVPPSSRTAPSRRARASSTSAGVMAAQKPWWQAAPP